MSLNFNCVSRSVAGVLSVLLSCQSAFSAGTQESRRSTTQTGQIRFEVIDISSAFAPNGRVNPREGRVLIDAVEKMMTPAGFIYAANLVNTYLLYDPGNIKAQFYRRLLAVFEATQGFQRRIGPLVQNFGVGDDYKNYQDSVRQIPSSGGAREYLLGGTGANLQNESQVQASLDLIIQRLEGLRQFLKTNKSARFEVAFFHEEFAEDVDLMKAISDCNVTQVAEFKYRVPVNCPHYQPVRLNVDRGDLETIQLGSAGLQISLIMTSAYNLTGIFSLGKEDRIREMSDQRQLSDREIVDRLKRRQGFGALRGSNRLNAMPDLGADVLAGFRWFKANETRFCNVREDLDSSQETVRENHLVKSGICVYPTRDAQFRDLTNKIEGIMRGQIVTETIQRKGTSRESVQTPGGYTYFPYVVLDQDDVRVDYMSIFLRPEADLRNALPNRFNACGAATSVGKNTVLSNLVPDGNGNRAAALLEMISSEDRECTSGRVFF